MDEAMMPSTPGRFRRLKPRRLVPVRRIVPSAITTLSLCCGLASMHYAMQGDFDRALVGIGLSTVFDLFDGLAARLLKAQSRFGAVLDSLSDVVCFGVAPALLLHEWLGKGTDPAVTLGALLVFVLCSAMRLARFTSAPKRPRGKAALSNFFTGMPTPAAAGCVLVPVMIDQSRLITFTLPWWAVIVNTVLISWLMISRVPMYALKHVRVKPRHVPIVLLVLALIVVGIVRDAWATLAALAAVYLLSLPLSVLRAGRIRAAAGSGGQLVPQPAPRAESENRPVAESNR